MTIETWTSQRVEQLRNCIAAGLTCSQIASKIGVTRNAVIGKINRLGLSTGRPAAVSARPQVRHQRPSIRPRLLRLIGAEALSVADDVMLAPAPVESIHRCSLLELARGKCRWPINDPGAADFAFCGNEVIAGFSYCAGHARMAYRSSARRHG